MARFLFLVVLFLPLFAFSAPQETMIKGKIIDKDNKGLPYVNVLLLNAADSALVKGSSSDENGLYEFEGIAPGSYIVMGSFLGYQKMYSDTFQVTGNQPEITLVDIKLIEDAEMLNEAVIVAQKPFIERQIDKTVVNVENSIVAAGNTALEVLKKSPGVMVDKDGNISLKGKSGVMIMFDVKPTYLSTQDISAMLTAMPADQIEKIEIITQPSALYDAAGNA